MDLGAAVTDGILVAVAGLLVARLASGERRSPLVALGLGWLALAAALGVLRFAGLEAVASAHAAAVRVGGGVAGLLFALGFGVRSGRLPEAPTRAAGLGLSGLGLLAVLGLGWLSEAGPPPLSGAFLGLSAVAWFHVGLLPVVAAVAWAAERSAQ